MNERLYSKIPLSQTIVHLCDIKGIHHIVISPGSRNAPLTIGFSEHPGLQCYSIVDERCAAFFALGLAQQLQQPVALVCTSGSALLNYYPAIAEAYYSDIPLVVLSADRPIERIDIGDGQTIRQRNVFENHILYSANLYSELIAAEQITDKRILQKQKEAQKHNEREINLALNTSIEQQGPVHINVPFYEPLYDKIKASTVNPQVLPIENHTYSLQDFAQDDIIEQWNNAEKKLILIGTNTPDSIDSKYFDLLAKDPSVLVLTETTSNIYHHTHIDSIDQLITSLNPEEFLDLQPDILVTIGGMVVSKRIKAFLRNFSPGTHWHIDVKKAFDTYFCLDYHVKMNPEAFLSEVLSLTKMVTSKYKEQWLAVRDLRREQHKKYLLDIPFSDLRVFEVLISNMPKIQQLQLSNSSTIRYAQLFTLSPGLQVFCNRGTSGIDGSTSTAIGAAIASELPTTLITGDLSFFYDSNALWNDYLPNSFRIIVINNAGGGIFRILPGKSDDYNFNTYFETTHSLSADHLCKMYGIEYHQAKSLSDTNKVLNSFYKSSDQPKLLEVFTPRLVNDEVLIDYFKHLV
ncbi:2-succinyl-5-enolpyruvyl-6-hydroxy-3-cyclohexene-1-carboxylic-acid synthase [Aquimarina intermedia]|uniref:2-succinyl-5-enolpyruvyl-6-hydroxy-3-cyclohexene-1-carboxylate synthase n=1 Tax=Aquimarina intermedia TaxID=350814 RepID=A0A5S5C8S8_9FLAO|nr:2-succinyl-5-enolpyruvyl-6-hydroxy-3-cyclohexene-1-carboxylic-acid synthase [Aquimarina intermedia]TYP75018.1 2-succinyl-5-enolpyruvyl-6-hydroxy-3-cyclohexene-1-carboxylate synthase [Aquimarina intermedia]